MNLSNFLFPPAIIQEYKKEQSSKTVSLKVTNDDLLKIAFFEQGNKLRGPDGRTYNYIDKDGNYVSSRVSPLSKIIVDNVEPGISSLVFSLIDKGYLTTGSCQGHEDSKWRRVSIFFPTKDQAEDFKDFFKKFKLPISFRYNFDYDNYDDQDYRKHTFIFKCREFQKDNPSIDEIKNFKTSKDEIVRAYNIMCLTNYPKCYILQMTIASPKDPLNITDFLINYFKYFYDMHLYKKRDFYTQKIVDIVKQELPEMSYD